jgi:hypothetical protein
VIEALQDAFDAQSAEEKNTSKVAATEKGGLTWRVLADPGRTTHVALTTLSFPLAFHVSQVVSLGHSCLQPRHFIIACKMFFFST